MYHHSDFLSFRLFCCCCILSNTPSLVLTPFFFFSVEHGKIRTMTINLCCETSSFSIGLRLLTGLHTPRGARTQAMRTWKRRDGESVEALTTRVKPTLRRPWRKTATTRGACKDPSNVWSHGSAIFSWDCRLCQCKVLEAIVCDGRNILSDATINNHSSQNIELPWIRLSETAMAFIVVRYAMLAQCRADNVDSTGREDITNHYCSNN